MCAQSCPTLHDPMDCCPPGSSVHGILQARILEWVVIPFSRASSNPGIQPTYLVSPALAADLLPLFAPELPGKPSRKKTLNQQRCFPSPIGEVFQSPQ